MVSGAAAATDAIIVADFTNERLFISIRFLMLLRYDGETFTNQQHYFI
jgi:hypothetical protein